MDLVYLAFILHTFTSALSWRPNLYGGIRNLTQGYGQLKRRGMYQTSRFKVQQTQNNLQLRKMNPLKRINLGVFSINSRPFNEQTRKQKISGTLKPGIRLSLLVTGRR